ncbi:hypothetical protein MVEN_00451100 [Mycena venus]|uniref:Uncharacterized protein n=1 Tax=Mycena venus TaxID=2733690 RepID=A0A8H7DBN9_9AGAR|nr:hypothetical protein MVEN_00451100 [Mycena venus]
MTFNEMFNIFAYRPGADPTAVLPAASTKHATAKQPSFSSFVMPHKKAKRSVREQERSKKGTDLAPTRGGGDALSSEPLPKSFQRAINAAQVRADYHAKRKMREEDGEGEDGPKKAKRRKVEGAGVETKIRPGETLAHFNKRIETDMRPLVRSAVQSSLATVRAVRKNGALASASTSAPSASSKDPKSTAPPSNSNSKSKPTPVPPAPTPVDKHASRPKEFARTSTAAPRRLNDIAQAPPELSALARKASATTQKSKSSSTKAASVLSPAQALQMAAAREAAVAHYRELKAAKRRAAGGGWGDGADGERGGGAVGEGEE